MHITKIIIPAAGIGSRFLPITKSIPKEMLPLSNKPAIEYIVQEAHDAGIHTINIVLSPEKNVIKDYFSENTHLNELLEKSGKTNLVASINHLIAHNSFSYFYQYEPAGLADALSKAQSAIHKGEFFAVALPDDIIFDKVAELARMIKLAQEKKAMVIAVQKVPQEQTSAYGIASIKQAIDDAHFLVESFIEKPTPDQAPSNYAIVGRYIFCQELFDFIAQTPKTKGEILLPETINLMIQNGYPVYAHVIQGTRFDTGTPSGWIHFIKSQTAEL